MPEFRMNKDGEAGDPPVTFDSLDEFTRGYIEALFFMDNAPGVSTEEWQAPGFEPSEGNFPCDVGFADIAAESLDRIRADCSVFQRKAFILLHHACESHGYSMARAGHDFWLTRCGHGAGFWDRKELAFRLSGDKEEVGERLSAVACWFGNVDSCLGDDGQVYV